MKKIYRFIYELLESVGRARAASVLTRQGRYKEAKELMLGN